MFIRKNQINKMLYFNNNPANKKKNHHITSEVFVISCATKEIEPDCMTNTACSLTVWFYL